MHFARPRSARILALAIAMLTLATVAGGAGPASASAAKKFTMVVTPPSIAAGSTSVLSVKFGNKSNVTMGAINLNMPPALSIEGISSPRGIVAVVGNQVQLRNLGLGAGKYFTVTVTAVAPCVPVNLEQQQSTLTWYVMATTGANFTGTSFALDTTNSKRTTKVTGICSLAFVDGRQPAGAHPGETITSAAFDPDGDPIQVRVLASGGGPSAFSSTISLAIGVNAGDPDGMLGGIGSQPTSGGVSSFDDLTIDQPGVGYTLVASAPGLEPVSSQPFTIADAAFDCVPDVDCVGELSDPSVAATVNAKADPSSPTLTMSLTPGGIDCADYEEHSSTLEFFVTTDRTKEVTMTVDTGAYPDSEGFFPIGDYQVCYESPNGFTDRYGSENVNLGLLPDCDYEFPVAPCVLDREQSYESTMGTITFITPAGDPKGRV